MKRQQAVIPSSLFLSIMLLMPAPWSSSPAQASSLYDNADRGDNDKVGNGGGDKGAKDKADKGGGDKGAGKGGGEKGAGKGGGDKGAGKGSGKSVGEMTKEHFDNKDKEQREKSDLQKAIEKDAEKQRNKPPTATNR